MMAASKGVVIAASMIGKFKTVFQMIAIVLFTIKDSHMIGGFGDAMSDTLWVVSWAVMLIAVALTIASMIDYLVKARDLIGFGDASATRDEARGEADIRALAERVVASGREAGLTVATAESLTGGLIGASITEVPGSSDVFLGGVMSYASSVKESVLGVEASVVEEQGVVSEQCACQMAEGARRLLGADIAVSVTGIAGPGGAEPGKPVGTVWMGVSTRDGAEATCFRFSGTRDEVREQTVVKALGAIVDAMR